MRAPEVALNIHISCCNEWKIIHNIWGHLRLPWIFVLHLAMNGKLFTIWGHLRLPWIFIFHVTRMNIHNEGTRGCHEYSYFMLHTDLHPTLLGIEGMKQLEEFHSIRFNFLVKHFGSTLIGNYSQWGHQRLPWIFIFHVSHRRPSSSAWEGMKQLEEFHNFAKFRKIGLYCKV